LFWDKVRVYRDIPEEFRALIEPVVEAHGLELVDVDVKRGGGESMLRVTVDTPETDGRVSVERCARLSREIGTHLDAADLISGRYRFEVSSPGLDRILSREKDFVAACGSRVRLETRRPLDGRRRFSGRLVSFDSEVARVDVDGHEFEIAFDDVLRANTVYQFSRADFSGDTG